MEFKETQRMSHWWAWAVFAILLGLFSYGLYQQVILGEPFGENPMSDSGLVVFALVIIGLALLFASLKLETHIDTHRIHMRYAPFGVKKNHTWDEIESARVVRYSFVGYGIRIGSRYGTVYNVKGNKGLAICLKNGKKFLIGTQQSENLKQALEHIKKS